jgi:hypothetical protein
MNDSPIHLLNWYAGWGLILGGFLAGAVLGLFFHHDDFLGGYASFSRRLLRLGHIALVAMGAINVLYSLGPWPVPGSTLALAASVALIAGGVLMPAVCFLTAWHKPFRHTFALPVGLLLLAVVLVLIGGMP